MSKRLNRNRYGSIVLPSGETITAKEQKAFRALVTKANRTRGKLIEALPEVAKQKHKDFNAQNEFYIRKKSKGFSKFTTKAEFNTYVRSVKHITSGAFEKLALDTKYSNYVRALYNTFNSKADDILNVISDLTPEELKYFIDSEELHDIDYVYHDPKDNTTKLEQVQKDVAKIKAKRKKEGKK